MPSIDAVSSLSPVVSPSRTRFEVACTGSADHVVIWRVTRPPIKTLGELTLVASEGAIECGSKVAIRVQIRTELQWTVTLVIAAGQLLMSAIWLEQRVHRVFTRLTTFPSQRTSETSVMSTSGADQTDRGMLAPASRGD